MIILNDFTTYTSILRSTIRVCYSYVERTYYLFSLIGRYISVEIGSTVSKTSSTSDVISLAFGVLASE